MRVNVFKRETRFNKKFNYGYIDVTQKGDFLKFTVNLFTKSKKYGNYILRNDEHFETYKKICKMIIRELKKSGFEFERTVSSAISRSKHRGREKYKDWFELGIKPKRTK